MSGINDPGDYTDGQFYILVNHDHALAIASGYVPDSVKAQARTMLDWREEDERRAARPVVPAKGRKERKTP